MMIGVRLACVTDGRWSAVSSIPNEPPVIRGRSEIAWKPHDAIEQHYFLSERRTVTKQGRAGLAAVEIDAQQHGGKRRQLDRTCNELAGQPPADAVRRIGDNAVDAVVRESRPGQKVIGRPHDLESFGP